MFIKRSKIYNKNENKKNRKDKETKHSNKYIKLTK